MLSCQPVDGHLLRIEFRHGARRADLYWIEPTLNKAVPAGHEHGSLRQEGSLPKRNVTHCPSRLKLKLKSKSNYIRCDLL
jgi:hypothetical protein